MIKSRMVLWIAGCAGVLLCYGLAAQLAPSFSFDRWDNFEYFTPTLTKTHQFWLHGHWPFWNQNQLLGQSLWIEGQPGTLYFPYTFCLALVRLLHQPATALMGWIALIHFIWAAWGWQRCLGRLGVRPALALAVAWSASFAGGFQLLAQVWIFVIPVFAWLPWLIDGTVLALQREKRGLWICALALGATACIGHPQFWIYTWFWWMTVVAALLVGYPALRRGFALLSLSGVIGFLWALPSMLPIALFLPFTERAQGFDKKEFIFRSVSLHSLKGLIAPSLPRDAGYLPYHGALEFFQGAWLPVVGFLLVGIWLRHRKASTLWPVRFLMSMLGVTVFWMILSFGGHTPLYNLTRVIPIWSSFRWPFKFLIYANASLALLSGLALEAWAKQLDTQPVSAKRRWVIYTGLIVVLGIQGLVLRSAGFSVAPLWIGIGSVLGILALADLNQRSGQLLFGSAALLTSVGILLQAQACDFRNYKEPYGQFGAAYFGLGTDDRVLPFRPPTESSEKESQPWALNQSASANNYWSATGTATAMLPRWLSQVFPVKTNGLLPWEAYVRLLGSPMLRSWNVRYIISRKNDGVADALLKERGYRALKDAGAARVYEDPRALARLYFSNTAKPDTLAPNAHVLYVQWKDANVEGTLDAPQGGQLVLAETYYPGWKSQVDGGTWTSVERVNQCLMGASVPPNSKHITFRYRPYGLWPAFMLAACGFFLLLWIA